MRNPNEAAGEPESVNAGTQNETLQDEPVAHSLNRVLEELNEEPPHPAEEKFYSQLQ